MITIMYYNHAQARKALLEKGREILVKDNMIDEEKARAEAAAHETASETVTRLEAELEAVVAAMGDMMDKYRGLQVAHCHYSVLFCTILHLHYSVMAIYYLIDYTCRRQ